MAVVVTKLELAVAVAAYLIPLTLKRQKENSRLLLLLQPLQNNSGNKQQQQRRNDCDKSKKVTATYRMVAMDSCMSST